MSSAHPARWSKIVILSVLAVLIVLSFSAVTWAVRRDPLPSKIDPGLAKRLVKAGAGQTFDVIFKLAPIEAPISSAANVRVAHDKAVRLLKNRSLKKQEQLLAQIKLAKATGGVKAARRFWIANVVAVKADAATVRTLAARPEVEEVFPNFRVTATDPVPTRGGSTPSAGNEWNINQINAPAVWSTHSTTGTGIKVAILDTGIDDSHPDLAGKVDEFVEIDEYGNATTTTPTDTDQHGTHVSGIVVGGDGGGTAIGVAPGARLMGAIVLPGGGGTFAQVIGGMEWAADPDGNPATADQPDVANMSWGGQGLVYQFIEPIDNLAAAGVFPAVAVGNGGEGWVSGPADVPTAFAVGATDKNDAVPWFSSGGEVTWYEGHYEGAYIKPDASAPGFAIKSSIPGGGYQAWSGTSMATPHMAGAAALLRSLNPSLTVDEISSILQSTALDLGAEGKDTRYGSGRIDVLAAANLAAAFGTVDGTVTASGDATQATAKIVEDPTGTVVATFNANGNGRYEGVVPPGNYRAEISKYGFSTTSSPGFALAGGGNYTFSPDLQVAPLHTLSGNVTAAGGGASLSATITVLSPVTKTTPTAGGTFVLSVPDGVYRLRAGSYGYKDKEATVTVSGGNVVQNFALDKVSPTLLVLDIGAGTRGTIYGPYRAYFTDALDGAGAAYDVVDLSGDTPDPPEVDAAFLSQYKMVVWAGGDGPATGAMDNFDPILGELSPPALASYLDGGGKLLITGQDVAFYMGWWRLQRARAAGVRPAQELLGGDFLAEYLHARLLNDKAVNMTVVGRPGTLFEGKTMSILGGDGANNQVWPDVIGTDGISIPELAYTKETTGAASLRTYSGSGNDGKVVYFSFGLESINAAADRTFAMSAALGWLNAPKGALSIKPSVSKVNGIVPVTLSGALSPASGGNKIVVQQKIISYFPDWDEYIGELLPFSLGADDPWAPPEPQTTWVPVAETVTAAGGQWRAVVTPMANSTYRAVWDGNLTFAGATSNQTFVGVKPKITVRPLKAAIPAGTKALLKGRLTPPPMGGGMLTLMSRSFGKRAWKFEPAQIFVDESGSFRIPIRPRAHTYYRLTSEKSEEMMRAVSPALLARTRHNLTLEAEVGLIPRDVEMIFSGRLQPNHSKGKLKLQRSAGGAWTTVATADLGGQGDFEIAYANPDDGKYMFRVLLGRDSHHAKGFSRPVKVRFY